MGKNIDLKEKFLEYFNEQEGFCLRSERLYDDLIFMVFNPGCTSAKRMEIITKWMEAAYRQGARDMAQDTVDTLGDYECALAGLEPEVIKPDEVYARARDNLMTYYTQVLDHE
jgi:hypothetical protein